MCPLVGPSVCPSVGNGFAFRSAIGATFDPVFLLFVSVDCISVHLSFMKDCFAHELFASRLIIGSFSVKFHLLDKFIYLSILFFIYSTDF